MGHFMDGRQDIGLIGNSMTPFAVRGSTFTRISYFRESVSRFYQMARGGSRVDRTSKALNHKAQGFLKN